MSESWTPSWPKPSPPVGVRDYKQCRTRVLDAVTALAPDGSWTTEEAIEEYLGEEDRVYPSVRWHLVILADYCEIENPGGRVRLRGEE